MKSAIHYAIGYIVGFSIFIVGIPLGLLSLSRNVDPSLGTLVTAFPLARIAVALVLFAVGVVFAIGSNLALLFIGKGGPVEGFGVAVSPRTKHLVTTGVYRYTRNPMVFGMSLLYIALSIYLGSLVSLTAVVVFVTLLRAIVLIAEERRLLKDFGDEYVQYKNRTPLLVPKL
jgi:protein-S-isoprenylcysteine O-methyltransferase Ste14